MTLSAGVLERMTSKASSHVEHGVGSVRSSLENGQGHVATRQFVVATAAVVGDMARCTRGSIQCRKLSVNVVLPARSMRGRTHDSVAGCALILGLHRWGHVLVAYEAFRIGSGGLLFMMNTETFGVEVGLHVSRMAARFVQARGGIRMAGAAVRHPELGRDGFRGVMTLDAVQHSRQGKIR